jgi:hypothetical protein
MRVLLTGMTRRQVGPPTEKEPLYFAIFRGVHAALVAGGHAVDWRPTIPGEDLTGRYDVAVIGAHSMGSLTCSKFKYGALWAAHQLPHVVAFEDWRVRTVVTHMRDASAYVWRNQHFDEGLMASYHLAARRSREIQQVCDLWKTVVPRMMLPAMPWSEPDMMDRFHRGDVSRWDINPFYYPVPTRAQAERVRTWLMVSLSPQEDWMERVGTHLSWPVEVIAPPRNQKTTGGVRTRGQRPSEWGFVPEDRLYREGYCVARGVFLPYYGRECPRGWWRNRWWLAAHSGAVLSVDPGEAVPDSSFTLPPKDVERMSDAELDDVAQTQHRAVTTATMTVEESAIELTRILERPALPVRDDP